MIEITEAWDEPISIGTHIKRKGRHYRTTYEIRDVARIPTTLATEVWLLVSWLSSDCRPFARWIRIEDFYSFYEVVD